MKSLKGLSFWGVAAISLLTNGPGPGIMAVLALDREGVIHDEAFGGGGDGGDGGGSGDPRDATMVCVKIVVA